jgi:hypothetical protein
LLERNHGVMRGHSRSKNGVASLAYVPRIHVLLAQSKAWMAGTSPAMMTGSALANKKSHARRFAAEKSWRTHHTAWTT